MKQQTALDILKNGHNVFLTGPAGSGKTYLLNSFIAYLKQQRISYAVTASTGIAATHLGGRTIHSWSGIGIKEHMTEKDVQKMLKKPLMRQRLTKTDILIIDEVSMLHAHQLDLINKILRYARNSWEPFGGMQVVLAGDFFQLPPVKKSGGDRSVQFVNQSQTWKDMDLRVCYLSEQYRQTGDALTQILSDIRTKSVTERTYALLEEIGMRDVDHMQEYTKLYTHNMSVDTVNEKELQKISGRSYKYRMVSDGNDKLVEALKNGCLAPEELVLKKGALVMFVRNNFDHGYVNGTVGTVVDFDEDHMPIVETRDGEEIVVGPETWMIEEDGADLASIKQLPLRLAWAITIHKSQGMTLNAAEIDLRRCFEYGMGYVALSRVRALQDIVLLGINEIALQVDPVVYENDRDFQKLSAAHEREVITQKRTFSQREPSIKKVSAKKKSTASIDRYAEMRKIYPNAYKPWSASDDTLLHKHIKEGTPIKKLIKIFGRQESALRSRIAKISDK